VTAGPAEAVALRDRTDDDAIVADMLAPTEPAPLVGPVVGAEVTTTPTTWAEILAVHPLHGIDPANLDPARVADFRVRRRKTADESLADHVEVGRIYAERVAAKLPTKPAMDELEVTPRWGRVGRRIWEWVRDHHGGEIPPEWHGLGPSGVDDVIRRALRIEKKAAAAEANAAPDAVSPMPEPVATTAAVVEAAIVADWLGGDGAVGHLDEVEYREAVRLNPAIAPQAATRLRGMVLETLGRLAHADLDRAEAEATALVAEVTALLDRAREARRGVAERVAHTAEVVETTPLVEPDDGEPDDPRARAAYEEAARTGLGWSEVAAATGYNRRETARQAAKRYARRKKLPFPPPVEAGQPV
jgi:hypothetical protein